MYRVTGTIQGVAPILFNQPTDDYGGTGSKTDEQRLEIAKQRAYKNGHGLFLPKANFKKCLLNGADKGGMKNGRKALSPFLDATVFVEDDLLFGVEEYDFMHEVWGRVPPRTGGMVKIRRPGMATGWNLPFALTVVDDRRTPTEIQQALKEAGTLAGLGSWRPEYGRFIVTEWNVAA